jgi:hypothetical protein
MEYKTISISGQELEGKVVVIRKSSLAAAYKEQPRLFKANGGFGCSPHAIGRAVFGKFLHDGEECRWYRGDMIDAKVKLDTQFGQNYLIADCRMVAND